MSSEHSMTWYIVYDISSDKIRKKISDLLGNYGIRMQKSLFECQLTETQRNELFPKIQRMVGADDSIRALPMCADCCKKMLHWGNDNFWEHDDNFFFVA